METSIVVMFNDFHLKYWSFVRQLHMNSIYGVLSDLDIYDIWIR